LFEGGCRVAACANWPGRINAGTVAGMIHAVDLYPTLAALAGAPTGKCKPLDGVNVWDTIAANKPSPRTEIVYNIEPFRGGVRQGDWKCIWRTLVPTSVDLYNLAEDPYEQNNLAAAHPDKVAAMQARINALGKECAKPLALQYIASVGLKHDKPVIGSEAGQPQAVIDGPSLTDEGIGETEVETASH
jgi:arylsulfatase A-like enzyme